MVIAQSLPRMVTDTPPLEVVTPFNHPPVLYRNLECDISMENRLAMRNTAMLKAYSTIDDRVRVLGYMVKKFAKVRVGVLLSWV